MTIYDAIKKRQEQGEVPVNVTCVVWGKAAAQIDDRFDEWPIVVRLLKPPKKNEMRIRLYTHHGRHDDRSEFVSLALGHFDTQLETAQAIAEQNFDTEGV